MKANEYIARFIKILDNLDKNNKKVPGLILSHAGFGKTSTVKKYCEYMDYNLITVIPSMYSSDDILGLQSVKDNKLIRLTPSWFNNLENLIVNGKRTLLFIDEITTCDPYVQGPLLDLIFNGNLGDRHLPENVFIIAAGNYSSDLNNVFKMSDPLINRFLLLNLNNDDFSIEEILDHDFSKMKKEDLKEFLNIEKDEKPAFNEDLFKKWISLNKEISFGKTSSENIEDIGLIGFTSIRSLDNSIKFISEYFNNYNDDLWTRVVGDSLGMSEKIKEMPLRFLIKDNLDKFKIEKKAPNSEEFNLKNIIDSIKDYGPTVDLMTDLCENISEENIMMCTSEDISNIKTIINNINSYKNYNANYINIKNLASLASDKLAKVMESYMKNPAAAAMPINLFF